MSSDEDSTSEGEKCSPGPQDYFIIMSNIFNPQVNRKAHKDDKKCTVCYSQFSLLGSNKKHYCKFCFRGVCRKCSSKRGYQPELQGRYRICDDCYQKAQSSSQLNEAKQAEEETNNEDEAKYQEMISNYDKEISLKKTEIEISIARINDEKSRLEIMNADLATKIESTSKEIRKKDQRIIALRENVQEIMKDFRSDKDKIKELKQLIAEQERDNYSIKEQFDQESDSSTDSIDEKANTNEKSIRQSLKQTLSSLIEQTSLLNQEIDSFRLKIDEITDEIDEKNSELNTIEKSMELKSVEYPEEEEEKETSLEEIKELQEKIMLQLHDIQILQSTLNKLTGGASNLPDSENRGICKCIVF